MDEMQMADEAARSAQQQVMGRAPAADAPLAGEWVQRVETALTSALEHFGAGDVAPATSRIDVQGTLPSVPPELMARLVAFQGAMQAALAAGVKGAKPYAQMDLTALVTSDNGLKKLASMLSAASRDQKLLEEMEDAKPPAPAPARAAASGGPAPPADMAADLED